MSKTKEHRQALDAITEATEHIRRAKQALNRWANDYSYYYAPSIDLLAGKPRGEDEASKAIAQNTLFWVHGYDEAHTDIEIALDYVIEAFNTLREAATS